MQANDWLVLLQVLQAIRIGIQGFFKRDIHLDADPFRPPPQRGIEVVRQARVVDLDFVVGVPADADRLFGQLDRYWSVTAKYISRVATTSPSKIPGNPLEPIAGIY